MICIITSGYYSDYTIKAIIDVPSDTEPDWKDLKREFCERFNYKYSDRYDSKKRKAFAVALHREGIAGVYMLNNDPNQIQWADEIDAFVSWLEKEKGFKLLPIIEGHLGDYGLDAES